MKKTLGTCLAILLLVPAWGNAVVIWDESVSGDLANTSPGTNLGTLGGGTWDVIGSLDGGPSGSTVDGADEFDVFHFTASGSWTLELVSVSLVGTGGLVTFLYDGALSFLDAVLSTSPTADLFGTLSAGTYVVNPVPQLNLGIVDYTLRISVASDAVPEPGTLALLTAGLSLLLGRRRGARA